jgi:hypothetical protein
MNIERREEFELKVERLKADNIALRRQVQHKQALATRLMVQRNSVKLINNKIREHLLKIIKKAKCKLNREANTIEMLLVIDDIVNRIWPKCEKILSQNDNLAKENSILKRQHQINPELLDLLKSIRIQYEPWNPKGIKGNKKEKIGGVLGGMGIPADDLQDAQEAPIANFNFHEVAVDAANHN